MIVDSRCRLYLWILLWLHLWWQFVALLGPLHRFHFIPVNRSPFYDQFFCSARQMTFDYVERIDIVQTNILTVLLW